MSRVLVPGERRTARDRAALATRAAHRRKRAAQTAVARFVAGRTDRQLERAPVGPAFLAALPLALRAQFQPDYAVDFDGKPINALLVLTVLRDGGRRRDPFAIEIRERRCRVRRHHGGGRRPDGTLTLALADLIRMATAAADPHELTGAGRLAVSGDTFLVVRFPGMFRQPTESLL